MLVVAGSADPMAVLQLWAAVISKLASDCVAGVIEGFADRRRNIAMRRWDYSEKLRQVFEIYSRLEIAFPTKDMLAMLNKPAEFIDFSRESNFNHVPEVIANALDLLYIMAYKPRAREALRQALEGHVRGRGRRVPGLAADPARGTIRVHALRGRTGGAQLRQGVVLLPDALWRLS